MQQFTSYDPRPRQCVVFIDDKVYHWNEFMMIGKHYLEITDWDGYELHCVEGGYRMFKKIGGDLF